MAISFSQLPADEELSFVIGDDLTMPFQIGACVTTNNTTSFVPTNITGYQFESAIKVGASTITGEISILSSAVGSMAVKWTDSQTSNLTVGTGTWYLVMIDSNQYERTIVAGEVEVYSRG